MKAIAAVLVLGAAILAVSACAPTLTLKGQAVQGGLIVGRTEPGARVTLDGRPLRVASDGLFVLGFGRDQPRMAELIVQHGDDRKRRRVKVRQRQYDIQRIDGLAEEMVTPPAEVLSRLKAEAEAVALARSTDTDARWFLNKLMRPTVGPVSGVFGSQRILNGEPRPPHYGIDFAAPEGAPVYEVAGGRVAFVGELYLSGNTVIVDHGFGVSSSYLHLQSVAVRPGDVIEQGALIGTVGATGRATAPHLHWGVNWFDVRLDPALLLSRRALRGERRQATRHQASG